MLEAIIRRGTLLTIAVLIVCVLGVLAAMRVPVQMIPDLEIRVITIETAWPGSTPQDIEKEILIEQEEYLRNLPGLQRMIATAGTGEAIVELEFTFGVDLNETLIRVNNALSQVPDYPENVDEPRIYTDSFSDNAFMYFRVEPLVGNPRGIDMDMMRDFVDDFVRTRMERVPGVSQVELQGGAERQVQIFVDPGRLAKRNISLTELRDAVRVRNQDISGGDIDSGKRRYLLRTVGRFDDLQALENLIVVRRGDAITRLRDVADVRLGHFEIRSVSYVDGRPNIGLHVRRETGSNVIEIKEAMMPTVAQINRDVLEPAGLRMNLTSDDVRYVQASIANVWQNLAIGGVLATLVMFLFLHSLPVTLIGVIGVPICAIAAFIGLLAAGRTINVISLAGVAFAIGMTLDNTIVVLESIEQQRQRGLARIQAALAGVRHVWPAVLASTLTTVFVFLPIFFVEQEAGQPYSDIAVAIAASILASMLVAITVVPTLSSHLPFRSGTNGPRRASRIKTGTLAAIAWLTAGRLPRLVCIVGTVAITMTVIFKLTPPAEYLPEGEESKTFSVMFAPPGYNLPEMNRIVEQLHAEFLPYVGGAGR